MTTASAVLEARERHHAATRLAMTALMAGEEVTPDVGAFLAYRAAVEADAPALPPQAVEPMPAMEVPDSSVVVLGHRTDADGMALFTEALVSAHLQGRTVQVTAQLSPLWWPEKINDAVLSSRGKYVSLLPYDDRLHVAFSKVTIAVAEDCGADIVYTDRLAFGLAAPREVKSERVIRAAMFEFGCPLPFTTLIRRGWWDQMGGFDGTLGLCNNDFYFRSLAAGAVIAHVPRPLVEYREHERQGHRTMDLAFHYAALYEKWRGLGLV